MKTWLLLALCPLLTPVPAETDQGDPEAGRRLYEQGIGADGSTATALIQDDLQVSGKAFPCGRCHRRSGFGSSEGGVFVPPVTAGFLFGEAEDRRSFLFERLFKESQPVRFWERVREPYARPPYTRETLGRVLRTGLTPGGQTLAPTMPRYTLSEADLDNLHAWLRQLSAKDDPGVDAHEIHLATLVDDRADPARTRAMLDTIRAFTQWMNLDTRGDLRNPYFSPHYRTDLIQGYRIWQMHEWHLKGPQETWPAQLAAAYRAQPVFAVVSGLTLGPWDPIHRFCEQTKVPCLFPHTDLPDTKDSAYETFYFHRGLELEAEVLAKYLGQDRGPVVQIALDGPAGYRPAAAFHRYFRGKLHGDLSLGRLSPEVLDNLAKRYAEAPIWVIWPGDQTRALFAWLRRQPEPGREIYLPSSAYADLPADLPTGVRERLRFAWPYERPTAFHPRAFRVRAWLRSRGLEIPFPRLQFDTYYALTLMQYGLDHIVERFSRDYLIEFVEHEAEYALNPGTWPRLALGPGQRFASKGAFVVRPGATGKPPISLCDWIVP